MIHSEWDDSNTLCCCEYYSLEEERSHILTCCCNCQALDDSFENVLTGQRIPSSRKSALMATIQDRIRIPWRGGAKQISADTLIPVILVPLTLLVAAFDLILTVLIIIITPIFLNHSFNWFRAHHPKTKFFEMWWIMSFVVVAFIFEVKVISLLEIWPEENITLGVLIGLFAFCAYRVKITANRGQYLVGLLDEENCVEGSDFCSICKRKAQERMYHCNICQLCVPERDYHFVWFDCCIGKHNNGMFLLSLLLAISALLYSTNLTLTTVCRPFIVFETILLPDDCSEVYDQYDMALCFTSAIYSSLMALYLLYVFLHYILIISLGLTGQEWRQLPFSTRLCCGLNSIRPYSKSFIKNWLRIFCINDYVPKNTNYLDA